MSIPPIGKRPDPKKQGQEFSLDPEASESDEPQAPLPTHNTDLPVGHARFDEAGQRIDYTA
ncbi:MAG: hypothetical protein H6830_09450 [Planctomycetes bacterium]|nr:hypothetical protein [Planctomycetota bacterium]MCB9909949.1 hypothetical protein [Planctomycetota bacterium]MCB9912914.1 hypothetical protein [Planctomycetota bacterium]